MSFCFKQIFSSNALDTARMARRAKRSPKAVRRTRKTRRSPKRAGLAAKWRALLRKRSRSPLPQRSRRSNGSVRKAKVYKGRALAPNLPTPSPKQRAASNSRSLGSVIRSYERSLYGSVGSRPSKSAGSRKSRSRHSPKAKSRSRR